MKWTLAAVVALAALSLAVAACGGDGYKSSSEARPTATTSSQPSGKTVQAEIRNFTHQNLTVPVGAAVVWTNRDSVPHTATSGQSPNPDSVWDTGALSGGKSGAGVTFDNVGAFAYYCAIHPDIRATVTVTQEGASKSEAAAPGATPEQPYGGSY